MADESLPHVYDVKEEIRAAIDAYEWKHSWHLPRDENGFIDWFDDKTLTECRDVLASYANTAKSFADKCSRLLRIVDAAIRRREPSP